MILYLLRKFPWLKSSHKETPALHVLTDEFYQVYKEEVIPILHKLFQILEEEEVLLTHSMRLELLWYQNKTKALKENMAKIPHKHRYKNSKPNFSKLNFAIYGKNIYIYIYVYI